MQTIPYSNPFNRIEQTCFSAISADENALFFPGASIDSRLPCVTIQGRFTRLNSDSYWHDVLLEHSPAILLTCWSTPPPPVELICSEGSSVQYICHLAGSIKRIAPRRFLEKGILVSNWGSMISHTIAEHGLLLALATLRNLPLWRSFIDQGPTGLLERRRFLNTRSLRGNKVGIHGFGNIARDLIKLLEPFNVTCYVYSEGVPLRIIEQSGSVPCSSLKELFKHSDIFFECEALVPSTINSITKELLETLPQDAVFVNIARGALVDENALASMARDGRLRVATDVLRKEPATRDSIFYDIPSVLLSPHVGGPTHDCYPACGNFAVENIRHFINGESPAGLIDLEVYDRST